MGFIPCSLYVLVIGTKSKKYNFWVSQKKALSQNCWILWDLNYLHTYTSTADIPKIAQKVQYFRAKWHTSKHLFSFFHVVYSSHSNELKNAEKNKKWHFFLGYHLVHLTSEQISKTHASFFNFLTFWSVIDIPATCQQHIFGIST